MIIAESIFSRIGNLRKVMSDPQIACLLSGTKGVESEHYKDLIIKVDDIVAKCPVTYQTDGQGDNAICQMHYFKGDSDVYIVELDVAGPPHTQAYGALLQITTNGKLKTVLAKGAAYESFPWSAFSGRNHSLG
ncbi:hypothetical protein Q4061_19720, partial [Acinetobacter baumannii]